MLIEKRLVVDKHDRDSPSAEALLMNRTLPEAGAVKKPSPTKPGTKQPEGSDREGGVQNRRKPVAIRAQSSPVVHPDMFRKKDANPDKRGMLLQCVCACVLVCVLCCWCCVVLRVSVFAPTARVGACVFVCDCVWGREACVRLGGVCVCVCVWYVQDVFAFRACPIRGFDFASCAFRGTSEVDSDFDAEIGRRC